MGKKRFLWIIPALLVCIGLVAWSLRSCFSSNNYIVSLPESPKALLALDVMKWADEADVDIEEVVEMLPDGFASDKMGIDWSRKIFAFITANENFGMLAPLADFGSAKDCFGRMNEKGICSELYEKRGYTWTVLNDSWLVGMDDDKFMILGPLFAGNEEMLRQEIITCFEQNEEQNGTNSQLYRAVNSKEGAIMCASHMDVIPDMYLDILKMGLPEHVSTKEIELLANIKLTPSEFCVDTEITSSDEDIRKAYEDWANKRTKIKAEHIGHVPQNALFWGCAGINGKRMLDHLRNFPEVRSFLLAINMGIDADLMLKAIDGDVSVMVPQWIEGDLPDFIVDAKLSNTDFLNEVDYWKKSLSANPILTFKDFGNNRFYISHDKTEAFFGVKDNNLYLTNNPDLADKYDDSNFSTINNWKKDINSSLYFAWLNCDEMTATPWFKSVMKSYPDMKLKEKMSAFSEMIVQSERPQQMKIRLISKKNNNLLKVFLQ